MCLDVKAVYTTFTFYEAVGVSGDRKWQDIYYMWFVKLGAVVGHLQKHSL